MNRITKKINDLREREEKAFIPFITAGYPDLSTTAKLVHILEKAGADIIELGIPFSDPLADGPTIQFSSHQALLNGTTIVDVFNTIKAIRHKSSIPLLVFAYTNLVMSYGIDRFFSSLKDCGCDGALIPDLPPEEAQTIRKAATKHGINLIFLISPLTSIDRMKMIEKISDDFVYCVSVAGVTGARNKMFRQIESYLKRVKKTLSKPFMVGFGVSSKEDARKISALSNGVVVGSALINIIKDSKNSKMLDEFYAFSSSISEGISKKR